ncbi:MAG: nuclear transport factor 2 family protein [Chloroflexales bacterium]|nr:nuclear transport factor 2 family protein [Chloroflexales bacterium]
MSTQSVNLTEQHEQTKKVINAFLETLGRGDYESTGQLVAEDCVFEYPYAVDGAPKRLEGRANIVEHALLGGLKSRRDLKFFDLNIIPALDPKWVTIEFRNESISTVNNQAYNQQFINIIRVQNGQITVFREYYHPDVERAGGNPRAKF